MTMNKYWILLLFSLLACATNIQSEAKPTPASFETILKQASDLDPKVLKLGMKAYENARQQGMDTQGILTIIDYSKPSAERRLWVIDLLHASVPFYTYVAHGKGSGDTYSTHFSNSSQSYTSSLGVFLTGQPYYGKNGYSLRLQGLEPGINDKASQRAIVMHPAWYVSNDFVKKYGRLGRSWGCPALDQTVANEIISTIQKGSIVFAYYPEQDWLNHSKYLV